VGLSRFPFVVSLSNHALRGISQEQSQARQRQPPVLAIPAKAGIHAFVIPAKAGIQGL
jgi:hypothetical protein